MCTTFRPDRTTQDCGKTKGGSLCIYINSAWYADAVVAGCHCFANLEYLTVKCRPFYLPREYTCTVITVTWRPIGQPGQTWKGASKAPNTGTNFKQNNTSKTLTRDTWQDIQAIGDSKIMSPTPQAMDTSLPDELNNFYARFDQDKNTTAIRVDLPSPLWSPLKKNQSFTNVLSMNALSQNRNSSAGRGVLLGLEPPPGGGCRV